MKIIPNGAVLLASLALLALLPACREERHAPLDTRGDTAVTQPARHTDAAPSAAERSVRPSATVEPASAPVRSDAQILSRTSLLSGRLGALANAAQGRTNDPAVLEYSRTLMSGYDPFLNRVDSISAKMGVEPMAPPGDSTEDAIRHALGILQDAPDGEVDSIFMAQTVASQQTLLASLKEMKGKAKSAAIRTMIGEMIPDVEKYLNEALRIQKQLATR